MTNPRRSFTGFTLVEVLAALAITGFVVLLAHRLLTATIDSARQLDQARLESDRQENGRRWLRAAFLSLEVGSDAGGFAGLRDRVTFTAWLQQPGGWAARRRMSIVADGGHLWSTVSPGPALRIADSVTALAVDYLLEPGANAKWVREWLSPLSAPLAVRFRISRRLGRNEAVDTLLLLIKERG
jgi:prepilin-type N-terminal cleavage/methylation domain-containing protein